MEEQRKKFGIEMLPTLHKRLKQRALDLDQPLWAITQEAIEGYLDIAKACEHDPDVENLRELKRIGEPQRVAALRENIFVFLDNARRALAARKRKGI